MSFYYLANGEYTYLETFSAYPSIVGKLKGSLSDGAFSIAQNELSSISGEVDKTAECKKSCPNSPKENMGGIRSCEKKDDGDCEYNYAFSNNSLCRPVEAGGIDDPGCVQDSAYNATRYDTLLEVDSNDKVADCSSQVTLGRNNLEEETLLNEINIENSTIDLSAATAMGIDSQKDGLGTKLNMKVDSFLNQFTS